MPWLRERGQVGRAQPGPITLIYARGSRDAVHSHIGATPANFAAVAAEAGMLTLAQPGRRRGPADVHAFFGVARVTFCQLFLIYFFKITCSFLIASRDACFGVHSLNFLI